MKSELYYARSANRPFTMHTRNFGVGLKGRRKYLALTIRYLRFGSFPQYLVCLSLPKLVHFLELTKFNVL